MALISSDSRYAIPGIISILVVLGIVSVGRQPFEPLRPSATERVDFSESIATRIEARLWQDPFRAIESFHTGVPDARERYLGRLWETGAITDLLDGLEGDSLAENLRECIDPDRDDEVISTGVMRCSKLPQKLRAFEEVHADRLIASQLLDELRTFAGPKARILLLPVALPVGDYADLIERRRRSRYAVVGALTEQNFLPVDAEHLRVLRFPGALCRKASSSSAPSKCQSDAIPYEYFKATRPAGEADDNAEPPQIAVVLWLEDRSLLDALVPMALALRDAFEEAADSLNQENKDADDAPSGTVVTRLFGPYSSGNLGECLRDEGRNPKRCQEAKETLRDEDVRIINWSATNRKEDIRWEHIWTSTINTDREQLEKLIGTVDRRVRGFVLGDRAPAPAGAEAGPGDVTVEEPIDRTVLLLAEGDTGYAGRLYTLAEHLFEGRGYDVVARSYVRGIDGQYPGHTPRPADRGAGDGRSALDANSVTARLLSSGYSESSSGTGQFDYLRRLSIELGESGSRIDAVGVLGSDPYDKALVLQALRPEFPQAVYFTTDLYSLFLREESQKIFQNLLVAASHGLDARATGGNPAARTGPPLRDSYQRSLYAAIVLVTRAATGDTITASPPSCEARDDAHEETSGTYEGDQILDQHKATVRLFEIGRGEVFELPSTCNPTRPGPLDGGWPVLSFVLVHLLLAALSALGIGAHFALWRGETAAGIADIVKRAIRPAALGFGGAFLLLAAASLAVRAYVGSAFGNGVAYVPTLNEQSTAACFLACGYVASLAFVSMRPLRMLTDTGDAPNSFTAMTRRDMEIRGAIGLFLIAGFSLGYVVVWLLPVLIGVTTGEVWSLSSGVSKWPSFACAMLILLLCRAAFLFIRKRSQYLKEDLHAQFNPGKAQGRAAPQGLLGRIADYHDELGETGRASSERAGSMFWLGLACAVSFALIAVMDNGGSLPAFSLFAGTHAIDPLQILLVLAVSVFAARLFRLGRQSRRLLTEVRIQQNQQSARRLLADASHFENLSAATGEPPETPDMLDDGTLEAHAEAYFSWAVREAGTHPKAEYRARRFSTTVKNALADIELVELVTKQIQRLFYLPVFVLVLFAVAALPLFDPWPISRSVLIFGGLLTTALVLQAWRLDFTARSVKTNLIDVLDARIASARRLRIDEELKTPFVNMLEHARHVIECEHEGAFLPLSALPLVRIIIVTVGAIGLIMSQAIFGTGFSL